MSSNGFGGDLNVNRSYLNPFLRAVSSSPVTSEENFPVTASAFARQSPTSAARKKAAQAGAQIIQKKESTMTTITDRFAALYYDDAASRSEYTPIPDKDAEAAYGSISKVKAQPLPKTATEEKGFFKTLGQLAGLVSKEETPSEKSPLNIPTPTIH